MSRSAIVLGLAVLAVGSGCAAEEGSAKPEVAVDDFTQTKILGSLTLGIDGAPDFSVVASATSSPASFRLGQKKCLLSSRAAAENAPKQQALVCGLETSDVTVVIAKSDNGFVARLAGRITDSQPICPWGSNVKESDKSKVCFPAGSYESESASPEIRLMQRAATGDHPFVVAQRVDEALAGLVGASSVGGKTIAGISQWAIYGADGGAMQPVFTFADGSKTHDCYSSSRPRVYNDAGLRPAFDVTNAWKQYLQSPPTDPTPLCGY